jgi:serine/threonine protein phosphatase PrpC
MISRAMTPLQTASVPFAVAGCAAQHRGDRPEQQDRVAILRGRRLPRAVLGLLADGVGGRSGASLASEQVVATAQRCFDEHGPEDAVERFFEDLVDELHVVLQLAAATAGLEPHSTLAAVLVQPDRVDWCHVGDSRIYHVRDGTVRARTVDDTFAEQLLRERRASPERARLHPSARLLTQALGGSRRPCATLGGVSDPRPGDGFVLCSDGAWGPLADAEIGTAVGDRAPRDAVGHLLGLARERADGHGDNCSLVLLKLEAVPAPR